MARRPPPLPYTTDPDDGLPTGAAADGRSDLPYKLTRTVVGMLLGAAVSGVAAWTAHPDDQRSNTRSYGPSRWRRLL